MNPIRMICMIALLGIALMCGCSHPQPQTANDLADGTITAWQIDTPNPLLAFVPEDAALVIATQRKRDIHSNGMLEYLDMLHDLFKHELSEDLERLLKYYEAQAPVMGLDPNGQFDFVAYLHDSKAVMHITVADEIKAAEYIKHLLGEKAQNVQNWVIYSDINPDEPENDLSIATHIKNSVLTIVISNSHIKTAPDVPNAQKKHFVPKVTNDDTMIVNYIHYERFVDFLLRMPAFIREYDYRSGFWHKSEGFDTEQMSHPTEWLKANGYTSVGDDVCIREFKSMVSEISSSNYELTLSKSGIAGMKFDTVMTSGFLGEIKSLMTEHIVLDDPDAKVRGHLSISIDKAVKLVQKIFFTQRDWKCTQARIFIDHIIDDFNIEELKYEDDIYINYIKDFESLSFIIKNVIIPEQLERDPVQFLVHMKHSPKTFEKIALDYFDIPYTDGVSHPISLNSYHKYSLMFKGNDAYFGSELPDPNKQYQRKTDAFADLTVQKSFLYPLLKDKVPTHLLWNYHLNLGIENNALVFSILPMND